MIMHLYRLVHTIDFVRSTESYHILGEPKIEHFIHLLPQLDGVDTESLDLISSEFLIEH